MKPSTNVKTLVLKKVDMKGGEKKKEEEDKKVKSEIKIEKEVA